MRASGTESCGSAQGDAPRVYLDWAASALPRSQLLAERADLCPDHIVNPHGSSHFAESERRAVRSAWLSLCNVLDVDSREMSVTWTSGGTEALNLACLGLTRHWHAPPLILVDAGAHAAMLEACRLGARESQGQCRLLPLRADGEWDLDGLRVSAPPGPVVVAVNAVNNETGACPDLLRLRHWMDREAPEAVLVVDGVQALGRVPIPFAAARIDLLALGGRKVGGPAASGALVRRRGVELAPLLVGGDQQDGLRAGTMDVVGILEFCRAAELAAKRRDEEWHRALGLADRLYSQLSGGALPPSAILSPSSGVPHIQLISFPGYEGAVVMRLLAERGVLVSTGSACRAESGGPSHVLMAMGIAEDVSRGALRISFGWSTSLADVDLFIETLAGILKSY